MINFEKIDLIYNDKKIIDQLSFNIKKGDKVAILGKSGLGKSSLFQLILGFAKSQQGAVFFDSRLIDERTVWDVRKQIAFIDQDVSIGQGKVIDWMHSIFGLKVNSSADFPKKEIEQLFEYFEMSLDVLDKNIENLSGGERQRVAIISAIILKRKVFLFDEITSALDEHLKQKVIDFFIRNKEWTVIVISHDSVWLNHPEVKVFDLKEKQWKQ